MKFIASHKVGSRVVCNPPVLNTDEDWLVLVENIHTAKAEVKAEGYTIDGDYGMLSEFMSCRKGELNLIITENETFYRKFLIITEMAVRLNLKRKCDRVAFYSTLLYTLDWSV